MEQLPAVEINVKPPLTVNHETSQIYSALRQCMSNNAMLRQALNEAAETIKLLTKKLNENIPDNSIIN